MAWILVLTLSTVSSDFLTLPSPLSQSPFIKMSTLLPEVCFVRTWHPLEEQSWAINTLLNHDLRTSHHPRSLRKTCWVSVSLSGGKFHERRSEQTNRVLSNQPRVQGSSCGRDTEGPVHCHTPISSQELQGWLSGPSGQPVHWQSWLLIWVAHNVSDKRSVTMGYTVKSISQMRSDLKSPSLRFSESK